MRARSSALGFAAVFVAVVLSWGQTNHQVDRVFYNAKIFTAEPLHPYAEAVAIRGDKVLVVGNRRQVTDAA